MTEKTAGKIMGIGNEAPGARAFLAAAALAAVFFISCFRNLENFSFSSSELPYVKAASEKSLPDVISSLAASDAPVFLHAAAMAASVKILGGVSAVSMRLPSVLFAALGIMIFFSISRRLFPDGLSGLATIVFAFSPPLCSAALDAGPCALFLLSTLATYRLLLNFNQKTTPAGKLLFFAALLVSFNISFNAAFTLPAGCFILMAEISGRKTAGLSHHSKPARLAAGIAFYYAAAAAFSFILRLSFGATGLPPASISGAGFNSARWAAMLFTGSSGGSAASGAPLAAALFPLVLFGALHLKRNRPLAFRAVFPPFAAAIALMALYFSSGINSAGFFRVAPQLGFATMVPAPFTSMFAAAALYYFFVSTFRRDALSIFTVSLLFRVAVTCILILAATAAALFFTGKSLKEITTYERENWPAAARFLAEWTRTGDTLMYHWQDAGPTEYYIIPSIEGSSAYSGGPETPVTWIVNMDPPSGFGLRNRIMEQLYADAGNKPYKGLYGTINIVTVEGTVVTDRADLLITGEDGAEAGSVSSGKIFHECAPHQTPCRLRLYSVEGGGYDLAITPKGETSSQPGLLNVCGKEVKLTRGGGAYHAEIEMDSGYCGVEITPPGRNGAYDFSLHKKTPSSFELFYTMKVEKK